MIGRVALSGICACMAIYIAVRAEDQKIQAAAALASTGLLGFTATSMILQQHRERKNREANTDAYLELLRQMNAQRPIPVLPQQPKVCRGCQHYHGRVYGGNLLVCGMHPYGVEGDRCADWEQGNAIEPDEFESDF